MKLTFLGAAHEVTGSCTLVEANGCKFLVDCGMEQGADIYKNSDLPVAASDIDYILLTHAHIDHSGKIPLMTANGFNGSVYSTEATKRLCAIMLMDSAHIQEFEAEWRSRKAKRSGKESYEPMYTTADAQKAISQFVGCEYGGTYKVHDGITVKFIDAGHLLGSSSLEITIKEGDETRTVLFSGDIGNVNRPLIRDPQKPDRADYVVIESTYGNRLHADRPDYVTQLSTVIQRTFDRGGNVVIPSFAVGRTQELLYLIRIIKEQKLIKNHDGFPVWVDSPLAVEATNIYSDDMMDYYDDETLALVHKGINPIKFPNLHLAVSSDESRLINENPEPKVIISASGMCEAGRIRHHLKHNLWCPKSTILFVGYQTEGTLGRKLLDGATETKLFGEEITVKAEIAQMEGISGHADKNMLLGWLKNIDEKPQTVFVNHGNDEVCEEFAKSIMDELNIKAVAPFNGAVYDIISGECLEKGNTEKIQKKTQQRITSAVFERLVLAGKRLMSVIEKNRGGTNKDLGKFADQINELSNKWER